MIGEQIDNYRIVEKIGDGGMGSVYKAVDVMLEREVALKFLRPELAQQPDLVQRFRAEAVILAKLNHQNIAALYGLHRHGADYFMAMEYVPGETLEAMLRREGRFAPETAVEIVGQILQALDYAHRRGVVHRDIKTANVILPPGGVVKVMDFGIARLLGTERQTRVGFVVGTIGYMAPEQIQGQDVDARTDIYAVGVVLYELLTGRLPFAGQSEFAIMQAQVQQVPPLPGTFVPLPPALEACVMRALAKRPDERFQTAAEFATTLLSALRLTGTLPVAGLESFATFADDTREFRSDPALLAPAFALPGSTPPGAVAAPQPPGPESLLGQPPPGHTPPSASAFSPQALAAPAAPPVPPGEMTGRSPSVTPWSAAPDPTPLDHAGSAPSSPDELAPIAEALPVAATPEAHAPGGLSPALVGLLIVLGLLTVGGGAYVAWQQWQRWATPAPDDSAGLQVQGSDASPVSEGNLTEGHSGSGLGSAAGAMAQGESAARASDAPASPREGAEARPSPEAGARAPVGLASPSSTATRQSGSKPTAPAGQTTVSAAPEPTPAVADPVPLPPPVPQPLKPVLAPASFAGIKWMQVQGGRVREVDAILQFSDEGVAVLDRKDRGTLTSVPYGSLSHATYSQGRRPNWRKDVGPPVRESLFDETLRSFHYVAFQGPSQFVLVRVDRADLPRISAELRQRSSLVLDFGM